MAKQTRFDRGLVRQNLAAARQRLQSADMLLTASEQKNVPQDRYYGLFEDALMAAGFSCALCEPKSEMRALLGIAARASSELFRLRGTLRGAIITWPGGEENPFVDTSITNPWTYVQAVYAALIADMPQVLTQLAALLPEDYTSEQVTVSPLLMEYSRALAKMLAGKPHEASELIKSSLKQDDQRTDLVDLYWLAQIRVLDRLVNGDAANFQKAVEELSRILRRCYALPEERNNPERFLELPVLGLTALKERIDAGKL